MGLRDGWKARGVTKFEELRDGTGWRDVWRRRGRSRTRRIEGHVAQRLCELRSHRGDVRLPGIAQRGAGRHGDTGGVVQSVPQLFGHDVFLRHLALHSDFSVDFTHPVDPKLAAFLQAPESVASLAKGGALGPRMCTSDDDDAAPAARRTTKATTDDGGGPEATGAATDTTTEESAAES